jgi:hypothetical protein
VTRALLLLATGVALALGAAVRGRVSERRRVVPRGTASALRDRIRGRPGEDGPVRGLAAWPLLLNSEVSQGIHLL